MSAGWFDSLFEGGFNAHLPARGQGAAAAAGPAAPVGGRHNTFFVNTTLARERELVALERKLQATQNATEELVRNAAARRGVTPGPFEGLRRRIQNIAEDVQSRRAASRALRVQEAQLEDDLRRVDELDIKQGRIAELEANGASHERAVELVNGEGQVVDETTPLLSESTRPAAGVLERDPRVVRALEDLNTGARRPPLFPKRVPSLGARVSGALQRVTIGPTGDPPGSFTPARATAFGHSFDYAASERALEAEARANLALTRPPLGHELLPGLDQGLTMDERMLIQGEADVRLGFSEADFAEIDDLVGAVNHAPEVEEAFIERAGVLAAEEGAEEAAALGAEEAGAVAGGFAMGPGAAALIGTQLLAMGIHSATGDPVTGAIANPIGALLGAFGVGGSTKRRQPDAPAEIETEGRPAALGPKRPRF